MGERLVHLVIAYLDTHVVVWLAADNVNRISRKARVLLESGELLVAPIVLLELEYLFELKRIRLRARDLMRKVEHELGLRVCDLAFPAIAEAALDEKWTRDPFDRMIVAQAKARGFASLISADESVRKHYPRTVW